TSYLESEALHLWLTERMPIAMRYDREDEFLNVVDKHMEDSWDDGAVLHDREHDAFADPEKVHKINHEGRFFNVPGPHLVEPSPQRTPVIFQAGASPRGRDFAARHAEAVFTKNHSLEALASYTEDLRERVVAQGRNAEDVEVFPMILAVIGATEEES